MGMHIQQPTKQVHLQPIADLAELSVLQVPRPMNDVDRESPTHPLGVEPTPGQRSQRSSVSRFELITETTTNQKPPVSSWL